MTCHNPRRRRIIIISLFSPCLRLIPCVRESSRGFKKQWWWAVHLGIYSWRPEILQQLTWYRTWPSPGHGRYLPGLEGTVGLWHLALISTSHFCIFLLSPQYVVCIVWPLMRGYHFWAWSSQTRNKGEDRLPRLPRLPSRLSLRLVCGGDLLPQGWPGRVSGERSPEGFVVSWFRGHSLPLAIWVFPCFSSLAGADRETLGLRRLSHRLANGASSGGRVGRVDYIMWCTCQRMERYGKHCVTFDPFITPKNANRGVPHGTRRKFSCSMVRLVRRKRLRSRRKPRHLRRGGKSAPECVFLELMRANRNIKKKNLKYVQHRPWLTYLKITKSQAQHRSL